MSAMFERLLLQIKIKKGVCVVIFIFMINSEPSNQGLACMAVCCWMLLWLNSLKYIYISTNDIF